MTIILRMQQLPWSATSMDIRRYFTGLTIPDGGVHIVGGENGDVFIAFSSDENARRAMQIQNRPLCGNKITLMLSSKNEMQEVIARNRAVSQTKSDPFQEDSRSQSPVPPNQPLIASGGDSLEQDREFAGFKDPSKSQPPSGQFDPKPQSKPLLPSGDPGAPSHPSQRPGGDKSLLGIPPYSNQPPHPAHGRQSGYFTDPNTGFGERRDEMYPAERRQGEQVKMPLIDIRRQPDIPTGHRPRDDGPIGEDKDMQPGGNSFRNREEFPQKLHGQIASDMDSRIPSSRRPPLLDHEPSRQDSRSSYGSYSDPRSGESLLDEPHNKRFKSGQEHIAMPPFAQGPRHPGEEKFGKPNIPEGRFDQVKHWDRPFEGTKQGPEDVKRFGSDDRMNQRSPMHDDGNRFDPDSRWGQLGARMGSDGRRFPGDPFGLNDPYDDPRGSNDPRDREGGRGGFDPGRRGPMEQIGPENYRKGDEPFPSGRDQKFHMNDAVVPGDRRGRDRFGPGERRGPGDHMGHIERRGPGENRRDKMAAVENRGPGDSMGQEDHRGPGMDRGPVGHDEHRDMVDRRGPESHMGFEERRVPGEHRGPDGRFGPEDPMHRSKDEHMSKDTHFGRGMRQADRMGSDDFMGLGGRIGPGDRMGPGDFMNPADCIGRGNRFGPNDRMGAGDHPGSSGSGERMAPDDHFGLDELMGEGPGERLGPGDHMGPGNRMGPGDFMDPHDFRGPGDLPGSGSRMGPGDRDAPGDRSGPGDPFRQGGRFGRDDLLGPDDQGLIEKGGPKGTGSAFGPEGRFVPPGPQDHTQDRQPDRRILPDRHDPLDRNRQEDLTGPRDSFGVSAKMGHTDQWRPRENARPSLLGQPGQLGRQDNIGLRDPTDYLDHGPSHPIGPVSRRDVSQGERQGPNNRMVSDDLEPVSRFRKESRFGPAVPAIHAQEKSMERDSDMRRGDRNMPVHHSSAGTIQLEGGNLAANKHSEARKKPGFVRITGLPYTVTSAEIIDFFDSLEIAHNGIRFCLDNLRKKPNGNGFIKFVSGEDAAKACKLNMKYMGKRYIEVKVCEEADWDSSENQSTPPVDYPSKGGKHSHRSRSRSRSPIRSLSVELRGIPHHADVQHIKDFFYGLDVAQDKIFIMHGSDNSTSGIAYVEFPNQQMFEKAMRRNERYIGRQVIELKPILKEVMNARIIENKKHMQDRQTSNRSSLSTRESGNSRSSGPRGSSSRDSKYSAPRDRDSRESSSRSSRDQESRQSSRYGRESQRSSEHESKSRDHDSRQNAARSKDSPKDASSRSSDSRSRYAREGTPQKRNGESKDQDARRSSSGSKAVSKDADLKHQESASKDEKPKSQQSVAQRNDSGPIQKDPTSRSKDTPVPLPKQPAEIPGATSNTEPQNADDKSCISMRNMPFNTSDDEIHKFFEDMELQPLMVHFLITPEGRPNGQAYVEFENAADAHKAATKKEARIRDRNIIMTIITKGHMVNCLAQGKPPPPSPALLGIPRGPPFPRPPMDFRPPLLGNQAPPFGMRNNPGSMRGPRPPPPIEVLIARGCVVETSNLPFDVPIPAIIDFFSNHNVVPESVRLKTNEHGRFSGEAMVAFRSGHDAGRAIEDLNHSILGGRVLRMHLMQPI